MNTRRTWGAPMTASSSISRPCPSKAAIQLAHRAGATVIATALQAEYPRAHALVADCLTRVASGELRVKIAEVFALSQAAQMHTYLEGRHAFGRVVMTM